MTRPIKFTFTNSVTSVEEPHDLFSYVSKKGTDQAAQIALIFGRNGSGKTTFGHDLFESLESKTCSIETFDGNTRQGLSDGNGKAAHLSLFNEDQLEKVRFTEEEDGEGFVKAIFLIDEQKVDYGKISSLKDQLDLDQTELEGLTKTKEELQENELGRAKAKIKTSMQEKAQWQKYHKEATGKQARVDERVFQQLKELCSDDTDDALLPKLITRRKELLRQIKSAKRQEPVSTHLPDFTLPWCPEHVNGLLKSVPSYQAENTTAGHFMELLKTADGPMLFKVVQEVLISEQTEKCPLCTQSVDRELKNEISLALTEIQSAGERAAFVSEVKALEKVCADDLDITEPNQRSAIPKDVLESYSASVKTLRNLSDQINGQLEDKANQPETVFSLPFEDIEKAKACFTDEREKVKNELVSFNRTISAYEENLSEFNKVNLQIASQTADVAAAVNEFLNLEQDLEKQVIRSMT